MEYSLAGAAEAVSVGKTTIHRAIKSGKLSATRTAEGAYRIDGAELARAFPPSPPEQVGPSPWIKVERSGVEPEGGGTELAVLRAKFEAAQAKIVDMERERGTILEVVDDLRKTRDALLRQLASPSPAPPAATVAQDAVIVPPAPEPVHEAPVAAAVTPEPPRGPRAFLARLLGR